MMAEKNSEPKKKTSVPSRPSFSEVCDGTKTQIEFECFDSSIPEAGELCAIITEVMMLSPDGIIRIAGNFITIGVVQEVFRQLRHEHLQLVLEKFREVTSEVKNKKAYLRTALYNSVFELEFHYDNLVSRDMAKGRG